MTAWHRKVHWATKSSNVAALEAMTRGNRGLLSTVTWHVCTRGWEEDPKVSLLSRTPSDPKDPILNPILDFNGPKNGHRLKKLTVCELENHNFEEVNSTDSYGP